MPPKIPENVLLSHARCSNKLADSSRTPPYPEWSYVFSAVCSLNTFLFPQISAVENVTLINKSHTLFNNV